MTLLDRYRGCLLGLACGDAVGTTVEFSPRGSFTPLTDMVGGGPFDLPVGAWTDDTSMALCFDIGNATLAALHRFRLEGNPEAGSTDPNSAGNGSIMRLAPVVLNCFHDR